MLALGAADPVAPHQRAACAALCDWVAGRRAAAQAVITAAAADRGADGGSTLQEQPEMAVPYLVYLLSRHPDMPVVGFITSGMAGGRGGGGGLILRGRRGGAAFWVGCRPPNRLVAHLV
jgi:hypothetical protein